MAWFPASMVKKQALIDMRDIDARTVRLWKETLYNTQELDVILSFLYLYTL